MGDVFAIVSKAVFEKEARIDGSVVGLGEVWPIARYTGTGKVFESALAGGGRIFMVTVRPPDGSSARVPRDADSRARVRAPGAASARWLPNCPDRVMAVISSSEPRGDHHAEAASRARDRYAIEGDSRFGAGVAGGRGDT